jgi:hypothetical protein
MRCTDRVASALDRTPIGHRFFDTAADTIAASGATTTGTRTSVGTTDAAAIDATVFEGARVRIVTARRRAPRRSGARRATHLACIFRVGLAFGPAGPVDETLIDSKTRPATPRRTIAEIVRTAATVVATSRLPATHAPGESIVDRARVVVVAGLAFELGLGEAGRVCNGDRERDGEHDDAGTGAEPHESTIRSRATARRPPFATGSAMRPLHRVPISVEASSCRTSLLCANSIVTRAGILPRRCGGGS